MLTASEFASWPAVAAHLRIGPYSHMQILIGLGVLAALIVTVVVSIWWRGKKG